VKIDKFIASWRQKISSSIGKDISPTVAESQVLSTIFWSGNTKLVSGLNSKKLSATLPSLKRKEWQNWLKEATQNRDKLQNTIQKYDDSVALYLEQIVAESGLIPEETEVSAENNSKSMEDFLALQKNVDELNGLLDPLLADCYNKLDQLETLKDKKEIWITLEQQLMLFTASLRHLNGELLNCQNSLLEISYMEKFRDKTKNVASHLPKLWMQRIAEQRLPQLTPLFTPVSKTDEIAISLELTAIKKIVDKLPKK
jgi:hypothetical protein